MNQQVNYDIKFNTRGDEAMLDTAEKLDKIMVHVLSLIAKVGDTFDKQINNINKKLKTLTFSAIIDQVERVADGLDALSKPGKDLSSSMYDLQAITGITGEKLEQIEKYARANAKAFGGDAAASVESYKLLLSQLTPEIANTPAALDAMGKSVSTTSKLMAGNTLAATEVLTTAMNQFQVSTADPIAASKTMAEMMNTMAAAAKEGSAELPQIKAAMEQAGMAAKGANVSFAETNAAIQVLDKAGKKGSEGGVAIRNMLAILGQGRFMPKDTAKALQAAGIDMAKMGNSALPLAERLKALTPVMNDSALLTKLFGMENQNAARALLSGIPELERLTTAITGTNTAFEQAAIIMESPAEKAARFQAKADDLKISLFNATGGMLAYAGAIGSLTTDITNILPLFSAMGTVLSTLTSITKMQAIWTAIVGKATRMWAGVQTILNSAFWANPLTWIIGLIIALIAIIGYVVYAYDGWGEAWKNLVDFLTHSWSAFKEAFNLIWLNMQDNFLTGIELIEKAWFKLKSLWDEDGAAAGLEKINSQQNERAKAILESQGKIASDVLKASESFDKISLKANGKGFGSMKEEIGKKVGISTPSMSGAVTGNIPPAAQAATTGSKTNEAIATGGTKSTNITISIKELIHQLNIGKSTFKESADEMETLTLDSLVRTLTMAQLAAGK